MFGSVLAACLAGGAVTVAARRLTRTRLLEPPDPEKLARSLDDGDPRRAEDALDALDRAGCEDAALRDAILGGGPPLPARRALDEHLGDVGRELDRGRDTPRRALRVAMAGGTLGATLELAAGGAGVNSWVPALVSFGLGGAGAAVVWDLGRRADQQADRVRILWDRVARALARRLVVADAGGSAAGPEGRQGPRSSRV